jgi:hypothetical protein
MKECLALCAESDQILFGVVSRLAAEFLWWTFRFEIVPSDATSHHDAETCHGKSGSEDEATSREIVQRNFSCGLTPNLRGIRTANTATECKATCKSQSATILKSPVRGNVPMCVLHQANPQGLTTKGTGHGLPARHDSCTTQHTTFPKNRPQVVFPL